MRRFLVLSLLGAMLMPLTNAHADDCASSATASAARAHILDPASDWNGNLSTAPQDPSALPVGDVYREGTDITAAWISGTNGHLTAHIQVANFMKPQRNTEFIIQWDSGVVPPNAVDPSGFDPAIRFVGVTMKGYDEEYFWGYLGGSAAPGVVGGTYRTEGNTTGNIIEGLNGTINIDIPATGTGAISGLPGADWGAPGAGAMLSNVIAQSVFLVGSPETLPPNPTGLRHGQLRPADDTTNGAGPDGGDPCEVVIDG